MDAIASQLPPGMTLADLPPDMLPPAGAAATLPNNVVIFGPNANCTLEICDLDWSVYKYRPSLAANSFFIAAFLLAMAAHIYLGWRWRSWWFAAFMVAGCLSEVIGYAGRLVLHENPFSFPGFMIQIIFVTSGPVYYTASIYITLCKTIEYFAPEVSRFRPQLFWWTFIPADAVCLVLQAAGGALSTVSKGDSDAGLTISMTGLVLQVVVLALFCVLFGDYMTRYRSALEARPLVAREKLFFAALATAVVLILIRCLYRCYELSEGYTDSESITDEGLFIALEGVLIYLAVLALCVGHPGYIFNGTHKAGEADETTAAAGEATELKPQTNVETTMLSEA